MRGTGGYYGGRRMRRAAAFLWWVRRQPALLARCWPYLVLAFLLGLLALRPVYDDRLDTVWATCDTYAELYREATIRGRDCQADLLECREGRR